MGKIMATAGIPVFGQLLSLKPFGSRNTSEEAKLFFGQAIQKTVA